MKTITEDQLIPQKKTPQAQTSDLTKLVTNVIDTEPNKTKADSIAKTLDKITSTDTTPEKKTEGLKQLITKIADAEPNQEKKAELIRDMKTITEDQPKNKLKDVKELMDGVVENTPEENTILKKYNDRLQNINKPINKIDDILKSNDEDTKHKIITELDKLKNSDNIDKVSQLNDQLHTLNKNNVDKLIDVRDNLSKLRVDELNKDEQDKDFNKQLEMGIKILNELIEIETKKLPEIELVSSISKYRGQYDKLMLEKKLMEDRLKSTIEGNFDKRADYLFQINQYREKLETDMYELLSIIQNKKYELKLLQTYHETTSEKEEKEMADYKNRIKYQKQLQLITKNENKLKARHDHENMKLTLKKSLLKKKQNDIENNMLNTRERNQLKLKSTKKKMRQLSQNTNFLKSIIGQTSVEDTTKTIRKKKRNNKRNTIRK